VIGRTIFAVRSPEVAKFRKFVLAFKNVWEVVGLNLPQGAVGSTTELRCVHDVPSSVVFSIFGEFLKKCQKCDHFLKGHNSAPGSKFKQMKKGPRCFFVVNPQKILLDILTTGTPSKPRV